MGVASEILSSLNGKLDTLSGTYDIAWGNTSYSPQADVLYLRPTHLPVQPLPIGVADVDGVRRDGYYQVDVFAPRGLGSNNAMDAADSICSLFVKGLKLTTTSGYAIKIITTIVEGGQVVGSHYVVPVLIQYIAITP